MANPDLNLVAHQCNDRTQADRIGQQCNDIFSLSDHL